MGSRGHVAAGVGCVLVVAAVPLLRHLDSRVALLLDAHATCGGRQLFAWISGNAATLGTLLVVAAVTRHLALGPRPRIRYACEVLAALGVGSLLIEGLKGYLDRPRPDAEFLATTGGSFPSGHVGNTVLGVLAFLCLWAGRADWPWSKRKLVGAVLPVAVVGLSRMYLGRHWLSDVLGTGALMGAFGALAFRHPDRRWRLGTIATVFVLAVSVSAAAALGWRLEISAGATGDGRPPVWRLAFGTALDEGRLGGTWSHDADDPRRDAAWMRASPATLGFEGIAGSIDHVRIVLRPGGDGGSCRRLHVWMNDRSLGDRLLHKGWRGYAFPAHPGDVHTGPNVCRFTVENEGADTHAVGRPLAAFSEITLHDAP